MEKLKKDYKKGLRLEDAFEKRINECGYKSVRATRDEDRLEGWDIQVISTPEDESSFLKNKKIDVKGIKGEGYTWLELLAYTSEQGSRKLGWLLRGKADYIAFETEKIFYIVEKNKLKEFVYEKIPYLKQLEEISTADNVPVEKRELIFCNNICAAWGMFDIIDDWKRKDEALYEKMYTRWQFDHMPDLLFKILNSDIEKMSSMGVLKNINNILTI